MSRIMLLENSLINKIAAGEVVERPLSVVKELIENSMDAGASSISIEISQGGIDMIRITDNGRGIPSDEVEAAFIRHATSKITEIGDLEAIDSFGFRGEALSSIASVSQVELVTRTDKDITGKRIEIHGGKVITNHELGAVAGTTIITRNLFYNVPARFKFLKKPAIEGGYISDLVSKLALGHPEISFKYINNKEISLQTSGNGDLLTVIALVYGKEIQGKLLPICYKNTDYELIITGYAGKPQIARGTRSYGNIFVNGRYVKSNPVQSAIEEAYKTKLTIGKFPVYIINIGIDPHLVDVNVHPAKTEVRFSDEDRIYECVRNAVSDSLKDNAIIPEVKLPKPKTFAAVINEESKYPAYERYSAEDITLKEERTSGLADLIYEKPKKDIRKTAALYVAEAASACMSQASDEPEIKITEIKKINELYINDTKENDIKPNVAKPNNIKSNDNKNNEIKMNDFKIIGQILNTYWIIERGKSIFIIDQHAAHERILYEELIKRADYESIASQQLLQPITIRLSRNEELTAWSNIAELQRMGFDIEEFGEQVIAIRAVPYIFGNPADSGFFLDILDKLAGFDKAVPNLYTSKAEIIAGISCKAAVKANDKLDDKEARVIIEKILELDELLTCPHGRPTIIELTQYELEKRFKRV